MRRPIALAAFGAILSLGASPAAPADSPGVSAHHGKVVETPAAGQATQGFLELDNSTPLPDILTGAKCPIAGTTSIIGQTGAPVPQLPVAAGAHLQLGPGGPHLLLQSIHFSVDRGGAVPCTLTFQNAGAILVYLYAIPAS